MRTITSADGTPIAYTRSGSGPAIIILSNVAEDHTSVAGLADSLSTDWTAITFDRRGRGQSGDPQPYDPAREVDDVAALIDAAGDRAVIAGGSGCCALALDAATALGDRVHGVYLYDPPFIVDELGAPAPSDYIEHVEALVAADRRDEAVEYFLTQVAGIPAEYIEPMRQDPSWADTVRYAHTFAYEGRILDGLLDGTPLPPDRWSIAAPVIVAIGEHSEPLFRSAAAALDSLLPNVTTLSVDGQGHGAFWSAPDLIASQISERLR